MGNNLYELADQVKDEETFLSFIQALCDDRLDEEEKEKINPSSPYGPGANGWENGDIAGFLSASAAWGTTSINDLKFYKKPDNPWRRAAHILHAGKFYE